jgi:hypothetical protein
MFHRVFRANIYLKNKKKVAEGPGKGWFDMKVPELTPELKRDMLLLKNRAALDPKQFYKRQKKDLPKFFQVCRVFSQPN